MKVHGQFKLTVRWEHWTKMVTQREKRIGRSYVLKLWFCLGCSIRQVLDRGFPVLLCAVASDSTLVYQRMTDGLVTPDPPAGPFQDVGRRQHRKRKQQRWAMAVRIRPGIYHGRTHDLSLAVLPKNINSSPTIAIPSVLITCACNSISGGHPCYSAGGFEEENEPV